MYLYAFRPPAVAIGAIGAGGAGDSSEMKRHANSQAYSSFKSNGSKVQFSANPSVTTHRFPVQNPAMQTGKKFVSAALIVAIFAVGIWLGFKAARWAGFVQSPHEENTVAVVQQIQTLSDLVTVKYVVEKVIIFDSPPQSTLGQFVQGENRILLLAHGIVKAGIDLKRLKADDVQINDKTIRLRLPPPQITDAYLDEHRTKVIDWQRGFLRDFDKDLEQTARENAVDDIRRAARTDGILKEANDRAQLELAVFLNQAGYNHVIFTDEASESKPSSDAVPKF